MDFYNSTIEEPLGFFEDYFLKNRITLHYEEYKKNCIMDEMKAPNAIKVFIFDGDCVIYHQLYNYAVDDSGNTSEDLKMEFTEKDSFSVNVEIRLKSQVEKSKNFLKKACNNYLNKFNDFTKFLMFQKRLSREILNNCADLFKEFPYCIQHLNSLDEYISELSTSTFIVEDEVNINNSKSIDKLFGYKEVLIHEIFDFWKGTAGLNNKGLQIMDSAEHERLISLITEMVFSEKSPVITRKFGRLPIPKALITFCFYVLKDNLYRNQRGKGYFVEFLNDAFADLADYKEKTLTRKFATPPLNEKWFPKIIQEAIKAK